MRLLKLTLTSVFVENTQQILETNISNSGLTLSSPILGRRGPGHGVHEAELSAHHLGSRDGEVIIAHRSPHAIVEKFHAAFVMFLLLPGQTQLDDRGVRL